MRYYVFIHFVDNRFYYAFRHFFIDRSVVAKPVRYIDRSHFFVVHDYVTIKFGVGITVLFVWDVKMEVMRYVSAVNFDFSAVSVVRFGIHVLYPYFRHKVGICQTLKSISDEISPHFEKRFVDVSFYPNAVFFRNDFAIGSKEFNP